MLLRSLTGFSPRTTWKYKSRRTRAAALPPNNIFPPYFPDAHLSDKSLGLRGWKPRPQQKTPLPCDGEWGWKDGWFSEARLLAATEDLSRHSRYLRRRRIKACPPRPRRAVVVGSGINPAIGLALSGVLLTEFHSIFSR